MEPVLAFAAIALLIIGLVGQGFEMRRIRLSALRDEDAASKNVFTDRRNIKWYAVIGAGIVVWYIGGG